MQSKPLSSPTNREILSALTHDKGGFWGIGLFSAIINLLMLAPALYMLQVYDRVLPSSNMMTLAMLTLMMLGLYLFMGLLEWVRSAVVIRLGTQMDIRLNQRIYNAAFESHLKNGGQLAGQALSDLTALRQFATGNALFAFFDAPWFPLYLLVIFMLHPWLGLLALGGAIVLVLLAWLNHCVSRKPLAQAALVTHQATQQASVNLHNADTIESMGMLNAMRQRWLTQHNRFLWLQNRASDKTSTVTALAKGTRLALQSLMLGLGALLAVQGQITPGMMIAGSILVSRVLSPIDQLIAVWKQWTHARLAYQRLGLLLAEYPARAEAMTLPAPSGYLNVEHLSTGLPGNPNTILNQINFTLKPGDVLGIIGPSGCGKSTLARLLVGVFAPTHGKVRLDGADLEHWDKAQLGPFIGYLPQDIQLFAGSIAQNIARFSSTDGEKIVAAAKLAGVHELILSLPQGYDTQLGEAGSGLSGGQKQRVALARAVYGNPKLLVLDEPNANLDDNGEKALLSAIQHLQTQGSTLVLITHKPALLSCANQLLILRDGQMQHIGAADKVLNELQQANKPSTVASSSSPVAAKNSMSMQYHARPFAKTSQE